MLCSAWRSTPIRRGWWVATVPGAFGYGNFATGGSYFRRANLPTPIDQLAVSPDGLRVVGIDRNGRVFAWDTQGLMPIAEAAGLECYATLLGRTTPTRKQYFSVFTKNGVEIYEDGGKVWQGGRVRIPLSFFLTRVSRNVFSLPYPMMVSTPRYGNSCTAKLRLCL